MALAQQRSEGRFHIYMDADPDPTHEPKKADRLTHVHELEKYHLEHRAHELFGVRPFVPANRLRQPLSLGISRQPRPGGHLAKSSGAIRQEEHT